ncbi:MAG: hypothetical protein Q4D91_14340 [Lautropia sp.]|nr:hypothetical protein [Lautropia sp.]
MNGRRGEGALLDAGAEEGAPDGMLMISFDQWLQVFAYLLPAVLPMLKM